MPGSQEAIMTRFSIPPSCPCYLCAGAVVQFGIKKVVVGEAESAPEARYFMESHGIEVMNLDLPECRQLMQDYIAENQTLWDLFLAELNPDLIVPPGK